MADPQSRQATIAAFLAAAEDHLALLEEHIREHPGYAWPTEMATLGFAPTSGRAVLAWLRTLLASGEWGR